MEPAPKTAAPQPRIATYAEFWPFYLREHSKPATKTFHVVGTLLGVASAGFFVASGRTACLPVSLVIAYGLAWYSHFFIQKNRPATFKYPLWSLVSDFRMIYWYFRGRFRPGRKP